MPLANSITLKKINKLGVFRFSLSVLLSTALVPAFAQDNSPYSRYGIGDLTPGTNVNSRAMGGISAAVTDLPAPFTINYSNPASYSFFQASREAKSKKLAAGRAILDVGINLDNRTLVQPNTTERFGTSNLLFSHVQIGVPLRRNWGLSFGIRPVSRVSYLISNTERLYNPNTGESIDTAGTVYQGEGGAYLPNLGTGFRFDFGNDTAVGKKHSIALGAGIGYLFGTKDISTRRFFLNDTLTYNAGNYQTRTSYGNLVFNGGLQYVFRMNPRWEFVLGGYGSMKRTLNASQDVTRETYYFDENQGNVRIDSVYDEKDVKGKIVYPSSYTVGFVIHHNLDIKNKQPDWLIGVDYVKNNWSEFRNYGAVDPTVKSNWQLRVGAQLRPIPRQNYFTNIAYRAGFFVGPDYIQVENQKLNTWGATFGFGLPIPNFSRTTAPNQFTILNLGFEYIRRGNNDNLLKENLFRVSFGLSLSDLWFMKRKYD